MSYLLIILFPSNHSVCIWHNVTDFKMAEKVINNYFFFSSLVYLVPLLFTFVSHLSISVNTNLQCGAPLWIHAFVKMNRSVAYDSCAIVSNLLLWDHKKKNLI